ncbi:MAG TPA: endonuclease/exonuclease/phosphatase family protein [Acidimicrobiia bacterium]
MLRVLTANVFNGHADAAAFGELLDRVAPDVVAAQELDPAVAAEIENRMHFGKLLPAHDYHGRGIGSLRPIEVEELEMPYRNALVGRLDDGTEVISAHLANPLVIPPALGKRRRQVEALVTHVLAAPARRVVVGDLNATPAWPAYKALNRVLTDGVADWAARLGREPERTWAYRYGARPMLRIDHALVSGLLVADASTYAVRGSDHLALVVDLEPVPVDAGFRSSSQ